MGNLTPSQLTNIKSRIKAEMTRRNGYGSLASYGTSSYDFNEAPTQGKVVKAEHGEKTINLLRKIETNTFPKEVKQGEAIPDNFDNSVMTALLTKLEAEAKTGNANGYYNGNAKYTGATESSSCSGACTGLCVGSCTGACNGCSTTCGGSCSTGCSTGCKTACTTGAKTG